MPMPTLRQIAQVLQDCFFTEGRTSRVHHTYHRAWQADMIGHPASSQADVLCGGFTSCPQAPTDPCFLPGTTPGRG